MSNNNIAAGCYTKKKQKKGRLLLFVEAAAIVFSLFNSFCLQAK